MKKKKKCSVCRNRRGFIGSVRLKDGNGLCIKCAKKAKFSNLNFKYDLYKEIYEMNLEEVVSLIKSREENRERLKHFEASKSFCGCVQIDEYKKEILFVKDSLYKKKRRLYKKNPPIFKVEELMIAKPIYFFSEDKKEEKRTGIRMDIEYFVGTLHPFINGFGIKLKKNVKCCEKNVDDEVEEMQQILKFMSRPKTNENQRITVKKEEWLNKEKYVKKLRLGVKKGYFEKEHLVEFLKLYYAEINEKNR